MLTRRKRGAHNHPPVNRPADYTPLMAANYLRGSVRMLLLDGRLPSNPCPTAYDDEAKICHARLTRDGMGRINWDYSVHLTAWGEAVQDELRRMAGVA